MDDAQRLALMTGFFRYILELAHQTMQILVTGQPGDPERSFNHDEFDDVVMLQRTLLAHEPDTDLFSLVQVDEGMILQYRNLFQQLQAELETTKGNRKYRAGWILNMLESRSGGWMNYDTWHPEVQALHSVLVVLSDGCRGLYSDERTEDDNEFAIGWWKRIREYVMVLEEHQPHPSNSGTSSSATKVIDLDTQVTDHDLEQEESIRKALVESEKQLQDHLAERQAEEDYMIRLVELHEQEERAHEYRQWEDWIVHEAMTSPPVKRARCTIAITAAAGGATSSSSLTIPVPEPGQNLTISLTLTSRET